VLWAPTQAGGRGGRQEGGQADPREARLITAGACGGEPRALRVREGALVASTRSEGSKRVPLHHTHTHTRRPECSEIRERGSSVRARALWCGAAVQAARLASTAAEQEYALSPPNRSFPPLRVPENAVARPVARHSTAVHVNIPPSPDLAFLKRYKAKSGKFGISVKFYVRKHISRVRSAGLI
jgi:hypothetical protein